ncbi:MAG: S46 family peptidase [Gemmataceae bacterium]|nr:S46 family peptidase [Gemmataceae bacterium]MDW8267350.1 S46 family peptidase [Gemmataceae bacterium]
MTWLASTAAWGDEGMWLFNQPPRALLQKKYGFELTDAWLERVRLASVRFNNGGSGSFVSPQGLVITNHHIGADMLQKLSSKERNYYRDGFYARTRADELKCPDLELNVLVSIDDVTERVNAAVRPHMSPAEAFAARRGVMAAIEKESLDQTGLRSDVVTLYQGGEYHLYRYKKYTDVRLVMAPEHAIAFFGGDTDNFEFPRYNLDICFFRVYENDRPLASPHFLPWSKTGPAEGELVFVSGHPGTTNRLETHAKLLHRRDVTLPYTLARLRALEAALIQFSERGPDQARMAANDLHRVANARKAFSGMYQGLLDPAILAAKQEAEKRFQEAAGAIGPDGAGVPHAIEEIRQVQDYLRRHDFEKRHALLERGDAFASELFTMARHLVRLATELNKPNTERLREYRDSNLESLRFQLFSPAPIHAELEQAKLAASLTFLAEQLGGDDPVVSKVLAGKNPLARAAELVTGCELFDPQVRRRLADGSGSAIAASEDRMIRLALTVDQVSRELRKDYETLVEERERQAYATLAKARFAIYGRSIAPDATFTLRLAFGVVRGYRAEGVEVPPMTTFAGLFERAGRQQDRGPFALPRRWLEGKDKLDLSTPFNFVSTADTIGGNSGSPIINRAGELVGINFDRNRFGLVRNFVYTDEQARHIAVHSRGILEALEKLYEARPLVKELTPSRP